MLWSKESSSIIRPLMHTRFQENNQVQYLRSCDPLSLQEIITPRVSVAKRTFASSLIYQIASIKLCWTIGSFDGFIISGRAGTGGASLVSNGSFSSSCAGVGGIVDS
jgi:hypothetical protein